MANSNLKKIHQLHADTSMLVAEIGRTLEWQLARNPDNELTGFLQLLDRATNGALDALDEMRTALDEIDPADLELTGDDSDSQAASDTDDEDEGPKPSDRNPIIGGSPGTTLDNVVGALRLLQRVDDSEDTDTRAQWGHFIILDAIWKALDFEIGRVPVMRDMTAQPEPARSSNGQDAFLSALVKVDADTRRIVLKALADSENGSAAAEGATA